MKKSKKEEISYYVPKWMKIFDENDGGITYEFSVHKDDLEETFKILNARSSPCSNWFACTCETCEEHHGEGFIHIELIHDKWSEHISKAINLLARTNYKRD